MTCSKESLASSLLVFLSETVLLILQVLNSAVSCRTFLSSSCLRLFMSTEVWIVLIHILLLTNC